MIFRKSHIRPSDADEKELIEGCLREDRRFQKELYDRYASKLLAVCCRYCRNREEAQDVLHEGFIKAIKDYVMFYTQDHHFIVYHSLKKLEQALPKSFQRIHHSYIINLTNLSEIKYHHCHVWGEKIPISKKYRAEVYEEVGRRLL